MSIFESFILFVTMVALAAIPSTSVAVVVTRSTTHGVANGISIGLEL
jgi:threonine/homoserine/homoserine lactone efflux protein